ncbi:unnamed protein product [Didymodactylos carnosus]|uniref:CN hydrolase domain-containing protein n=1 Tax=Didymodactylos carnosus TaxID=1234261 RepID=A0A814KWV0_9BILA|nr:unnamed protein product [Didymodactylos carnosus]CAF1057024.1 unnamed protein product [Didymodactylos carnosus]CAF3512558.1 unnamed protein product [Didymodactylos carnosus]CAF3825916.1 unnamed protein product [Didymodactylos carnosus]
MYWISIGVSVYIEEFWWAIPFALFGLPIILAFFIGATCDFAFLAKKYNYYQFIFCISWIRLVQPSIPQSAKWDIEEFWRNLDLHINLSEKPGEVDLIIWSEAALVVPYVYEPVKIKILNMLQNKDAILITGGVTENGKVNQEGEIYTSLYALTPEGEQLFEYHKSHLVPFGEYMPLKKLLPLKKLTPGIMDYTPGDGGLVKVDRHNLTIKPLICYESIFPNFVRTTNEALDLIINVTNDAWYEQLITVYPP